MYIFCIHCIHYVYRILTFTLGSLADRQAAPPISRGSSAHGLDHPQSPRPILPPFRAFDDRFQLTEENQERERGLFGLLSRESTRGAASWRIAHVCVRALHRCEPDNPPSVSRPRSSTSTKRCATQHAACCVLRCHSASAKCTPALSRCDAHSLHPKRKHSASHCVLWCAAAGRRQLRPTSATSSWR